MVAHTRHHYSFTGGHFNCAGRFFCRGAIYLFTFLNEIIQTTANTMGHSCGDGFTLFHF